MFYFIAGIFIIFGITSGSANPCNVITRKQWNGETPYGIEYMIRPVQNVIIHHTVTPICTNQEDCSARVKNTQNYHMNNLDFNDIGYNFLIGGDGHVYEGAGFHIVGAHTRGYNTKSLGIAFIGNFEESRPTPSMLQAARNFLQCAKDIGELDANYKLFGGRQVQSTISPGAKLYREIRKFSHFSTSPP